jgi:hypothetical protein
MEARVCLSPREVDKEILRLGKAVGSSPQGEVRSRRKTFNLWSGGAAHFEARRSGMRTGQPGREVTHLAHYQLTRHLALGTPAR